VTTRDTAVALDARDPLRTFRRQFVIADPDLIYLDGNSLGRLPRATRRRLHAAIDQWGVDLIRGWDRWIELAREAGDVLAEGILEVRPGEVIVSDSTSVNLYKLAAAALDARPTGGIVTDDDLPTDLYVLEGLAHQRGLALRVVSTDIDRGVSAVAVAAALDDGVALVSHSHVAYRSGAIADMAAITRAAHDVGALVLWDTSHSAGSIRVPLASAQADLAVGCTYKHLNGGRGRLPLRTSARTSRPSCGSPSGAGSASATSSAWPENTIRSRASNASSSAPRGCWGCTGRLRVRGCPPRPVSRRSNARPGR
jgi:kynureninase